MTLVADDKIQYSNNMRKYIIGILSLFLAPISNAQIPETADILRAAKASVVLKNTSVLQSQLTQITRKIMKIPSYHIPVNLQHPLNPNQAVSLSHHLLKQARLKTSSFRAPAIEPLEQNLSRYMFTIVAEKHPAKPLGTGFIFATQSGSEAHLWGATTADVVQNTEDDLMIQFMTPHQAFTFPAKVVLQTPSGNAALLELPQSVSQVALPIPLNFDASLWPQQELLAYGIRANGQFYKAGHSVLKTGTERTFIQAPTDPFTSFERGGLLVDQHGQAVGIYHSSHSFDSPVFTPLRKQLKSNATLPKQVSEIIPIRQIFYLLKEYEKPHSASRIILFGGRHIGKLGIHEKITAIYTHSLNKPIKKWEPSPLWSLRDLSEFIDLEGVQKAVIVISAEDETKRAYTIDLNFLTVTQMTLP